MEGGFIFWVEVLTLALCCTVWGPFVWVDQPQVLFSLVEFAYSHVTSFDCGSA